MKKVFLLFCSLFLFFSCTTIPREKRQFVVASNGDVVYQQDYEKLILWEYMGADKIHLKSASEDKVYTLNSDILMWDKMQINKNNMLLYSYGKNNTDRNYLTLYDVNNKKKIKTFTYSWSSPDYYWDEITNNFYISSEYGIIEYNERGKKLRSIIEYPHRFLPDKDRYNLYDARNNELLLYKSEEYGKQPKLFLMDTKSMQMQLIYSGDKEDRIHNGCLTDNMIIWIKNKMYVHDYTPKDYCLEAYDRQTGKIKVLYKSEPEHRIVDLMVINNLAFFKDNDDNVQFNILTGEKKIIGKYNYFTDGQYIWIERKEADGSSQIIKEEIY